MRIKFGILRDGELLEVSPTYVGAKRVTHSAVPEFDQLSEMVVFSHYEELPDRILGHSKIEPLPEDDYVDEDYYD